MTFYNEITALLKKHGYKFERQAKGSHEFWCKDGKNCVSIPSNLKSRHTANKILKDANIQIKI